MIIITAAPDQYEAVRAFYHSMIDAMAGSTVYVGWKKDIYPTPEFLKESILKGELYLVLEGEQIVSAMVFNHDCNESYSQFEWQTATDDSEIMVIHILGVHPHFSGKGYAKALVRKAIELATENGMKAIRLDVLEGNTPAENLYLGFGFQYMTTIQMYYEDTGWANFKLYEYVIPEKKIPNSTLKHIIRPCKPGGKNMKLERITESNLRYAIEIQKELFPGESAETNYEDSLEESSPLEYYLIQEDGVCAGVIGIYSYPEDPDSAWLGWFGIRENFRRKHLGSEALKRFEEMAAARGYRYARLYTDAEHNDAAIAFYKANGYLCEPYLNKQDPACRQYPTLIFSKPLTCDALVPWNSRNIHLTEQIAKQQKK